jgi:hypothetical protein
VIDALKSTDTQTRIVIEYLGVYVYLCIWFGLWFLCADDCGDNHLAERRKDGNVFSECYIFCI